MTHTDKILLDTVHTLLCDKSHADNMVDLVSRQKGQCYYYLEDSLVEGPSMEDHLFWAEQVKQLKELLKQNDSALVLSSIYRILDLLEKLSTLTDAERELFELLNKA